MDLISEKEFMEGYSKTEYHIALGRRFINSNSLKMDTIPKNRLPEGNRDVEEKHLTREMAARLMGKELGKGSPGTEGQCEAEVLGPPSVYQSSVWRCS